MALVNKDKNYIFFHFYKCGGNSVRQLLDGEEVGGVHSNYRDVKKHFESQGDGEWFEKAFKFTFIRHPYDMMGSLKDYISRWNQHPDHKVVRGLSNSEFISWCRTRMTDDMPHLSNKYQSYLQFISDESGEIPMFVGLVEDIESDLYHIMEVLDISGELPLINKGVNTGKYWELFSDEDKKAIREIFKEDFEKFGFTK